jgi:hypothetical protein
LQPYDSTPLGWSGAARRFQGIPNTGDSLHSTLRLKTAALHQNIQELQVFCYVCARGAESLQTRPIFETQTAAMEKNCSTFS